MKKTAKYLFAAMLTLAFAFVFGHEAANHFMEVLPHGANLLPGLAMGVGVGVVDVTRQRWAFERLAPIVGMINQMTNRGIIINEDSFRSEQLIQNSNANTITFETYDKTMQTNISTWPLQKGVKDNDIFYGIGYRIFIDHRASGATAVNPQTYPNPLVFTPANTGSSTDLFSLFNGTFSFQVGRTVFIPGRSVLECLNIPQTQQTLAGNFSQFDGGKFAALDPYPVFSGRSDNKLILSVKTPSGWAGAATSDQNVVTFEMTGYTLQNAESFLPYLSGEKDIYAAFDRFSKGQGNELEKLK